MRKITEQAVSAFFGGHSFKGGNTKVEVLDGPDGFKMVSMRLHDHLIATLVNEHELTLMDAGWQTMTTKERLNGVISWVAKRDKRLPQGICQKDGKWYYYSYANDGSRVTHDWDGMMVFEV